MSCFRRRCVLLMGALMMGAGVAGSLSLAADAGVQVVWIEAEQFDRCGGWVADAQFIDQMGSPYLLANGIGRPVEDAATSVEIPAAGRYRLWVRTKDWVPDHHPGRFKIIVDGLPPTPANNDKTFGENGRRGWQWEDGGVYKLAGNVEVRLHDLTGYYGRCDAIVLIDDLTWKPPADKDAIARLRQLHGGVSREVEQTPAYDVVVVGGGVAGCMAAVSAARNGAHTALIQNRPLLGGNASVEILVPPVGSKTKIPESGLIEEVRTAGNQLASETWVYSGRLQRLVDAEENLDLLLNTHATGVEMDARNPSHIAAILAMDTRSGRRWRFPGRIVIDCTGDGVIGIWAGAEYRHGREPRSMHDESLAPELGNRHTMGNSLKFAARRTDSPKPFATPAWAFPYVQCDDFGPQRHPMFNSSLDWQWRIELGGLRDTYHDAEEIRDDLLRIIYGMWDHVKNHCPRQVGDSATNGIVARCELAWVGFVAGKRESNRLIGDYIMTEQDFTSQTLFPDRIAYGGWGLDDHTSAGFFGKDPPSHHVHGFGRLPHSIPYRSIYSNDIDNLMMAGRNISVTHVALGTTRVMLTCGVVGHAAGTAAGMCVEKETTPRGVYQEHIAELQQRLLKEGAYLIGMPNRDPSDLARAAEVTASSEETPAAGVIDGFSRPEGQKSHVWQPESSADGPHWICLTWLQPQTFNVVHVTPLAPVPFSIEAWLEGSWKKVAEGGDGRFRRNVLAIDDVTTTRLRVLMSAPQAINEIRVYREDARQVAIARRAFRVMRPPITGPGFPWGDESVMQVRKASPPRPSVRVTGIAEDQLPGILLDAKKAQRAGDWDFSAHTGPFIGDGYLTDGNRAKGSKAIRFTTKHVKPGKYEVRVAYSALANRASNTPITVAHADGSQTRRIDQRKKAPIDGLFFSLGVFPLNEKSTIVITNAQTDGYVIIDAIQLLPK